MSFNVTVSIFVQKIAPKIRFVVELSIPNVALTFDGFDLLLEIEYIRMTLSLSYFIFIYLDLKYLLYNLQDTPLIKQSDRY